MKVKELIDILNKCNPEYEVLTGCCNEVYEVSEYRNLTDESKSCVTIEFE